MILLSGLSRPRDEALLFRQKCPKPFPPVRVPPKNGEPRPGTEYMARKLAESILSLVEGLKQSSPNSRIRYRGSAAPEGERFLKKQVIKQGR